MVIVNGQAMVIGNSQVLVIGNGQAMVRGMVRQWSSKSGRQVY